MEQMISLSQQVITALRMLNQAGYEAWVVGGAVRSGLLHLPIHDFDITTNALPQKIEEIFSDYHVIETGIRHGTVTVVIDRMPLEITTYRTESTYSDHRHPDAVSFTTSLEEDCARRDFTINALCYHPVLGLKDFFHGIQDLQNHLIRAIGDPEERFEEDALRILRAVRFSAQLGFTIEKNTDKAVYDHCQQLSLVASERLEKELTETLEAPHFPGVFKKEEHVFDSLIPELREIPEKRMLNLYDELTFTDNDAAVRMALILREFHDPERARNILRRLKFPKVFLSEVNDLLTHEALPMETRVDLRKILYSIQITFPRYLSYRCALRHSPKDRELLALYQSIQEDHDCFRIDQLAINGTDLLKIGKKGKEISETLQRCLLAVMEDRVMNQKDALLAYAEKDI